MVLDAISSPPFADVLSQTIEGIIEVVHTSRYVLIENKSFAQLSSYLDRLIPLLKELNQKDARDSEALKILIEVLNRETKLAQELITECSEKNKFYLLMNCRLIAKRMQNITREIGQALCCIPLASLDISSGIEAEITQLVNSMHAAEFRAAVVEEKILERIELGIQERNVDRSYANNLLVSIAEAIGISTEQAVLKKEFEEFKKEIENERLRKDHAEAMQMEQIIALLERADAASTREDKEKKYFTIRKSLASHPFEPLEAFCCPITKEVMKDPVETPSGHTFERSAIEKWLAEKNFCPLTSTPLDTSMLRPNKTLRQSIEEWRDRNTMITIASMKSRLSSEEEGEVLDCLQELKDLCEKREIHREWVVLEDHIPMLVKLLSAKSREIISRSLLVLHILAKDSDECKESIVKVDNAMESIVRSLGRRIGVGKLAVGLLLELAKSESIRDCIGEVQGCIFYLVNLTRSDDNQASRDARDVLKNLSFSDDNVIQMVKANYFKYLLQRLSSGSDYVKMRMAATLGEMEFTDHNKSSLFEEGVLDSLLNLVSHGNLEMKMVAVKAILNLSSLTKNGQEMIRQGAVRPLLDILYCHTSQRNLCELVAETIVHLALSTVRQDSSEMELSLLESNKDIRQLFSLINLTWPAVQQRLLQAFYTICQSPSATAVQELLNECCAVQILVQLCELDNHEVRVNVVKLLCCLIEKCNEATITEHVGQKTVQTLLRIIEDSENEEEVASALGIIANLPMSTLVSDWLLEGDGLRIMLRFLRSKKPNGPCKDQLIENAVGALCHFTVPANRMSQQKAAEADVIPLLVQLLESGTSLTKRRAAISLSQLSESSSDLCRPIPKHRMFWCFSALPEAGCPVHRGICAVRTSFCLLEAGAVGHLVKVLGEPDPGACEASLDALLTLVEGDRLQGGSKVLDEERAIPSMIKLLGSSSPRLQEKILTSLEKIFQVLEIKQKYGPSVQMSLVDLTQRGSTQIRPLAARILAQLNVLHELPSYF
ncbi:U-box domain-containing protein 44-like [Coffea eugenioides]|uniref:U-box domain-containing protein 44-like n=1 Tax=Coffea eugenioides TaxID=49369 RepID=UPI000F608F04|nr:U-box domain-containing protein 44-like [Coffea eugenioides]XP_027163775.1 U-box domain-containing protein 44-like [Coffea eugenioides]